MKRSFGSHLVPPSVKTGSVKEGYSGPIVFFLTSPKFSKLFGNLAQSDSSYGENISPKALLTLFCPSLGSVTPSGDLLAAGLLTKPRMQLAPTVRAQPHLCSAHPCPSLQLLSIQSAPQTVAWGYFLPDGVSPGC